MEESKKKKSSSTEVKGSVDEKAAKAKAKKPAKAKAVKTEPVEQVEKPEAATAVQQAKKVEKAEPTEIKTLADFITDETIQPDVMFTVAEQNRHFGPRIVKAIKDGSILQQRLGWKRGYGCKEKNSSLLLDVENGETVGIFPCLPLKHVWRSAKAAVKGGDIEKTFGMVIGQWEAQRIRLEKFIRSSSSFQGRKEKRPVIVQDLFAMTEKEYQELFFEKGREFIDILRAAIQGEIAETVRLKKRWHKIKRYKHKVSIEAIKGGIFSTDDAEILRAHGIRYLNDLRKCNVYDLKNMLLDHSFTHIIEEINAAFKEDKQRRKDRYYQTRPFAYGFIATIATAIVAYSFKYTLLKNEPMTYVIVALLAIWMLNALRIVWGAIRAKLRRKKRPSYVYFSVGVRKALRMLIILSLFSIGSTCVFYERYDGYNETVYYRDLEDGTIAVAGLVDTEIVDLAIPQKIDDKIVTEVDFAAFYGDDIERVSIPKTVMVVDAYAFANCEYLENITLPAVDTVSKGLFSGCTSLTNVAFSLDGEISTIEKKAFHDCYNLETLELPSTVTTVERKAFDGCSELRAVELSNVQTIGKRAFRDCESLEKISLDNVVTIERKAFEGCYGLYSINIGNTLENLEKKAFKNCSGIKSISLPFLGKNRDVAYKSKLEDTIPCDYTIYDVSLTITDMPKVYRKNFEGDFSFKSIAFGDATTEIESGIFASFTSLKSITLSNTMTVIPEGAFENCWYLETVYGGESVTEIHARAFNECRNLRTTDFVSVQSIGTQAFASCTSLYNFGESESIKYIGESAFYATGSVFEDGLIANDIELASHAFCGSDIESISLSGSVKLGEGAFSSSNIEAVDFSNAAIQGGQSAFAYCSTLDTLLLPDTMQSIPSNFASECGSLESLTWPSFLENIGDHAFSYSGVRTLKLPEGIKTIGASAFYSCGLLNTVTIPDSIERIGQNAFAECYDLEEVIVPYLGDTMTSSNGFGYVFGAYAAVDTLTITDMTSIASNKLTNGSNIKNIILNEGLTTIGNGTFANCYNLQSIKLPTTLTTIGARAFYACENLGAIDLSSTGVTRIESETFSGCSVMEVIVLPTGLTAIGDMAFYYCRSLQNLDFSTTALQTIGKQAFVCCDYFVNYTLNSDTLVSIGDGAFMDCDNLNTVVLNTPALTSMGNNVFRKNAYVNSIEINAPALLSIGSYAFSESGFNTVVINAPYLESIGASAFQGDSNLQYIGLETPSLSGLGDYAFRGVTSLQSVDLSKTSLEKVGKGAFSGCYSLSDVYYPGTFTEISEEMFVDCSDFTYVTLPSHITKIGPKAYYNCYNVSSIVLHDGITEIGKDAFALCSSLTEATLPFFGTSRTSNSSYYDIFADYRTLKTLTITDMETITAYNTQCANYVTNIVLGEGVKVIDEGAFEGFAMRSISFSSNLERIEDNAFANCSSLFSVDISSTAVTTMGESVFSRCANLQSVQLPYGLTTVSNGMFYDCDSLTSISLPNNVTAIGDNAFRNCDEVQTITFGNSIATIGEYAFAECLYLQTLALPSSVVSMGKGIVMNCSNLTSMTLPSAVTEIPDYAFYGTKLPMFGLTASIKKIGESAFANCQSMTVFTGSISSATEIGESAFEGCIYLNTVTLNSGLKVIGKKAFNGCASLQSINIPDTVTTLGANTFSGCSKLTSLSIPDSVTSIGESALYGCSALTTLTIPFIGESATSAKTMSWLIDYTGLRFLTVTKGTAIAENAFKNFSELRELTLANTFKTLGKGAFTSCLKLERVSIPETLKSQAAAAFPVDIVIIYTK